MDLIEPFGFLMDDRRLRRAGMDYRDLADCWRHSSWEVYRAQDRGRLLLLTTKTEPSYLDFSFRPGDRLLLGRESARVPDQIHQEADASLTIPMQPES